MSDNPYFLVRYVLSYYRFHREYRDTMKQDHRKYNKHRIVIGTVNSEPKNGVKESCRQWMRPEAIGRKRV